MTLPPPRSVRPVAWAAVAAALIALVCAWSFGPLAESFDAQKLAAAAALVRDWPLAPLVVAAVFVLANVVAAPGTLLIGATILLFGPLRGSLYAYAGLLISASVVYTIGRCVGRAAVEDWVTARSDPRWAFVHARLARRGLVAVALTRLTPIPFAIQNLALGASRIGYADFVFGSMIGLIPVVFVMAGLATQFEAWLAAPDATRLALFCATVLAAVAIGWWLRRRVAHRSSAVDATTRSRGVSSSGRSPVDRDRPARASSAEPVDRRRGGAGRA